MDKAEALKVAVLLTDTYDELEYSYKMGFGIPLKYDYIPEVGEVSNLANFIINTEDKNLYSKTFEKIDSTILHKILGILSTKWFDIDERDREEYENGSFGNLQEKGSFEYLHNLVSTYKFFYKVYEEMNMLRAVFKNLIPPHQKEDTPATKKSTNKKGRKKDVFSGYISGKYADKTNIIIDKMKKAIGTSTGKYVAEVIASTISLKYIRKPGYTSFIREFGNIITDGSYRTYITNNMDIESLAKDEIKQKLKI